MLRTVSCVLLLALGVTAAEARVGDYDGTWSVSAGGFCASSGVGQVVIVGRHVIGPNGRGSVTAGGAVTTMTVVAGMTVIGHGQISGNAAHGFFRESGGCAGAWSAVRD